MDPQPPQKYRLPMYGGGIEELDRFEIRNRIRALTVGPGTELAFAGTEDWRPANSFPELARYFELASTVPRTLPGVAPKAPLHMESMGHRMAAGLLYPLRGGEAITLIVLAIVSVFPFISFLATLASTVMMLSVIRRSAEGSTKMPSAVDAGSMDEMIRHYLRVTFVTLVSLSPLIVLGIFFIRWGTRHSNLIVLLLAILACLAFAILYYPACLATVAVWDSVLDALNPVYVSRVIAHIGTDYFIVIGAWFAGIAATTLLKIPALSPLAGIPIVGGIFGSALSLWLLFYSSHLLGYAVYRHSAELGWD